MVAALARRLLWRLTLAATGGLRVEGRLPRGGSVVVANHTSHADSAALLAAVGARHRPRIAAAVDYWFTRGWRAAVCRALAAGFPVRRGGGGGGSADLDAAAATLRNGRSMVVYPEGTRSRDGRLRPFRTGAARLAATAGVPLVPVAISGTRRVLPVHGRLHRGRVTVRIGTPVTVADPKAATDAARSQIGVMLSTPPTFPPRSRSRELIARAFAGRLGVAIVGGWAVAEAVSWPVLPEVALFAALLAVPRRWWVLVPTAVAGSVAGGVLAWTLAATGIDAPQPLTTEPMRERAAQQLETAGATAVRGQPLSGVPFKVYAVQAGRLGVDPVAFAGESVLGRAPRIATLGLVFAGVGALLDRRPRAYPWLLVFGIGGFIPGLVIVLASVGASGG
ncbi:MAG: 1-acyl-sn-glycerol-3-phosphate acyltransferase [Actinomycetota bacterium]